MHENLRWPARCGCTPGSRKDGWHEQRCAECGRVELAQWGAAISQADRIVEDIVRRRAGSPPQDG